MNVQPVRLEGPSLILDPLTPEHASALWPKTDPDLFRHTLEWPRDGSAEAFQEWLRHSLAIPASLLFIILVKPELEPVAMTGSLDIRPVQRGLGIGRPWIATPHQGPREKPDG